MTARSVRYMAIVAVLSGSVGFALGAGSQDHSEALMIADRAFNRALQERNREAFSSWIAEEAVFFGGGLVKGREQIVERWSVFMDPGSGRTLTWKPHTAVMSGCEDLGYTIGDYESETRLPDGATGVATGSYVSVWRRTVEGAWRVVADAGTPPE